MGIFGGQKKDKDAPLTPESNLSNSATPLNDDKGLAELKRLTMGQENSYLDELNKKDLQKDTKSTQNESNKNNLAYSEEQKLFTQVNSFKELAKGEVNYEIPKELYPPKTNKELPKPNDSKKEEPKSNA